MFHHFYRKSFFLDIKYFCLEKLSNLDKTKSYILVCNHQSFFDVVIVGPIFPKNAYVIAKNSLKYIPYFGLFYKLSGNYFIKRGHSESAKQTMANVIDSIKENKNSVLIFPQGTRTPSNEVVKLKRGFIDLAKSTQSDILPFVISTFNPKEILYNFKTKKPLMLKICDLISYQKPENEIMEELKNVMNSTIKQLDAI
jgi:1-acyl-sn-glycerol-3-phosphate acyltransferase